VVDNTRHTSSGSCQLSVEVFIHTVSEL